MNPTGGHCFTPFDEPWMHCWDLDEYDCEGGVWTATSDLTFDHPEYGIFGNPDSNGKAKIEDSINEYAAINSRFFSLVVIINNFWLYLVEPYVTYYPIKL